MSFDRVIEERCGKIKDVLKSKALEYSSNDDRFHNFNVAARVMNTTPEKALLGMMMKHYVSVLDIIESPDKATGGLIDEKIGDMINYLILLEGLLLEPSETSEYTMGEPKYQYYCNECDNYFSSSGIHSQCPYCKSRDLDLEKVKQTSLQIAKE